ncbi:MAG: hypothetical protein SGILL_000880 [Bacillariaceae sp.]
MRVSKKLCLSFRLALLAGVLVCCSLEVFQVRTLHKKTTKGFRSLTTALSRVKFSEFFPLKDQDPKPWRRYRNRRHRQKFDDVKERVDKLLQDEHERVLSLVPKSQATFTTFKSGLWTDPSVWAQGSSPQNGGRIHIQQGHHVRVTSEILETFESVFVEGRLAFDPQEDTSLKLKTMVVGKDGFLVIGNKSNRVMSDKSAQLILADRGPRDRTKDPFDLTGGLISMGHLQMFGVHKTGHAVPQETLRAGIQTLTFSSLLHGWQVGDRLLVPGVDRDHTLARDEIRSIKAVVAKDGRTEVNMDQPLQYDHFGPEGMLLVTVGNLSRNIVIKSERPEPIARRGHFMILHRQTGVEIDGASFVNLGRTNALYAHTDPALDDDGKLVPGSDVNTMGRYPLHVHGRDASHATDVPMTVRSSVIEGGPKYGLVNHGAHVVAEDNIAYNVSGTHFFTENGSEIGAFRRNLAVRSAGNEDDLKYRMYIFDFGHGGHGFWMTGGAVEVTDNYAFGHRQGAYIYHTMGAREAGRPVFFATSNVKDHSLLGGQKEIHIDSFPFLFSGNVAAGAEQGVENVIVRNLQLFGDPSRKEKGVWANDETDSIVCEGLTLKRFDIGIFVPRIGSNAVKNCSFECRRSIYIQNPTMPDRITVLTNNTFGNYKKKQRNIYLAGRNRIHLPIKSKGDLTIRYDRDRILLDKDKQIYFPSQISAANSSEFSEIPIFGSMTGGEIWDKFHLAVGGVLAPEDSHRGGLFTNGWIGSRAEYPQTDELVSRRFSCGLKDYVPVIRTSNGTLLKGRLLNLDPGWNLVATVGNQDNCPSKQSFLVYGDASGPTFEFHPKQPRAIHRDDLTFGFLIAGEVVSSNGGKEVVHERFRKTVAELPLDAADGTVLNLDFNVTGISGCQSVIPFAVLVSKEATRRGPNLNVFEQKEVMEYKAKSMKTENIF